MAVARPAAAVVAVGARRRAAGTWVKVYPFGNTCMLHPLFLSAIQRLKHRSVDARLHQKRRAVVDISLSRERDLGRVKVFFALVRPLDRLLVRHDPGRWQIRNYFAIAPQRSYCSGNNRI
jgi:hypothetical protein